MQLDSNILYVWLHFYLVENYVGKFDIFLINYFLKVNNWSNKVKYIKKISIIKHKMYTTWQKFEKKNIYKKKKQQ